MLEIINISKEFEGICAVDEVSFTVERSQRVVIVGESGCGKTTTLKMINRLIEPSQGQIRLKQVDVSHMDETALRRGIGYVIQNMGLFPHMTVARNIATVPLLLKWGEKRIQERINTLLELVKLDPESYQKRLPVELSGGEQQRVGFARALAAEPPLMLLDEPFGALDPITRDQIQTDFIAIQKDLGFATVMVTHDMNEALRLGERIIVMRRGRIVAMDTPQSLLASKDDYVQQLIGAPLKQTEAIQNLLNGVSSAGSGGASIS